MGLSKPNVEKNSQRNSRDLLRLLRRMKDPLATKALIESIEKIKGEKAVRTLIYLLKSDEDIKDICQRSCVRKEVIEALVRIGEPSVKPLVNILKNRHAGFIIGSRYFSSLPFYAQRVLVRIGESSVKPLIQAMHGNPVRAYSSNEYFDHCHEWRTIASIITDTLVKIGKPSIRALIQILKNERSFWLKYWAKEVLSMKESRMVIKSLIQALGDRDEFVKETIEGIGSYPESRKKTIKLLICALQNKNAIIRSRVAEILVHIHTKDKRVIKQVIGLLIHALKDISPDVRASAAWALGFIGDRKTIEFLARIYKEDHDRSVRKKAKQALQNLCKKYEQKTPYNL